MDISLALFALGVIGLYVSIIWRLGEAKDEVKKAVETEAKLIHRRIDDLTGEIQLAVETLEKIRVFIGPPTKPFAKQEPKPKVYDWESSQRATLEEFKEPQ